MKKTLVFALMICFVFALSGVALAQGIPPVNPAAAEEGGYLNPTAGQNPHGNYAANTNKCKVCHAVHGATAGGEALLRSTKSNACVYCHVSATYSIKHPYGTNPANYTTEYENNHAATHQGTVYNGCVSCHSVHGADSFVSAADGITSGMILRKNPGGTIANGNTTGAVVADVTTLNQFCRDCHDGTTAAGAATCLNCHNTQMQVSDFATRNQVSHIQTSTLNNAQGTQVANLVSTNCRDCHKGAATYADGASFPHLTPGADFLADTHTATSPLDAVCLDCHQWGGTNGVGKTF